MSGLVRNVIAFLTGLLAYGSKTTDEMMVSKFWVTPFDSGIRSLKSDKYLQFAETAQVDYMLKCGIFFPVLSSGASFVNLAQLVKFSQPVSVFSRLRVETKLVYADEKCAYFSHLIKIKDLRAAEVLVKMKFKRGRATVAPSSFLAFEFAAVPHIVASWESTLEAL